MDIATQLLVNGLMLGSVYALVAIGFTLVFGLLHKLNFAHGDVFMAAGFVSLFLIQELRVPPLLAVFGGILGAGLLGNVIELLSFRAVKGESVLGPAISSLAFGIVLIHLATIYAGSEPRPLPGVGTLASLSLGSLLVSLDQLLMLLFAAGLMFGMTVVIRRTRLGRAMRAIAENEAAAHLVGVPVSRIISTTFFISSVLAGVAGLLVAIRFGKVDPFIGGSLGFKGLFVMVVGGMGNAQGSLLAGLVLGLLESVAAYYISALHADALSWFVLILILFVNPSGLLGAEIERA